MHHAFNRNIIEEILLLTIQIRSHHLDRPASSYLSEPEVFLLFHALES